MTFDRYISCDILKLYVKSFAIQETDIESSYKVLIKFLLNGKNENV
jgi:hypothetical protein